jgi:MFS family permease
MSAGFTSVSASLFLTGLFGIIKLLSATSFMFVFVHYRGNRFWLLLGSAICGVSMLVLSYCVHSITRPTSAPPADGLTFIGIISILMVYVFAFAFGISLGPLSWNICSEIFPANLTTLCCAITTSVQWLFQIVIAAVTPPLLAHVGWATYIFYALCCGISFVWMYYCVPETKAVKLGSEMDNLFGDERLNQDSAVETGEMDPLLGNTERQGGRRLSFGFSV